MDRRTFLATTLIGSAAVGISSVASAVALPKDIAPNGKITLVATQRCNVHGLWESTLDIELV
jgi:desulfoferrodoxin (superoxide reductase-like protein)